MELEHEIEHATRLLARKQDGEPCQFSTHQKADSGENRDDERRDEKQEAEKCLQATGLGVEFKSEFCWLAVWFGTDIGELVKHVCRVRLDAGSVTQPIALDIPQTLVALTGNDDDPPLQESAHHCRDLPNA